MPSLSRQLDRVDANLLALLRRLVSGQAEWPLYLFGAPGRGKTSAALALADVVETAVHATCDGLADATMSGNDGTLWERVRTKHLAILDELGARERVTDLGYSTVKRFLDLREQQAGRVAIYIANVEPESIAGLYDDRIASRLLCGVVFKLDGDDRRLVA
jgi:hypothetical protein